MKFKCHVTQAYLTQACENRQCMWWSTNKVGCMALPHPPEPEDLTDAFVAKHKGCTPEQVAEIRKEGARRIDVLLTLHSLFEWMQQTKREEWPWCRGMQKPEVQNAVNRLCEQQWPYTVRELGWTPAKVAVTLHKATLTKFNTHTGKQIDWLVFLGIKVADANALINLFKTACKENQT